MPLGSEMNVLNLLDLYPDKIFCIPKTYGNQMDFIEYDQTTKLIKTNFGLLEPESGKVLNDELDLVIVPALGMTKDGYRWDMVQDILTVSLQSIKNHIK